MAPSGLRRERVLSPLFVIAAALMVASALGLRPTMDRLAERYRKEPIEPRRSLRVFDVSALRSFVSVAQFEQDMIPTKGIGTEELCMISVTDTTPGASDFPMLLFVTYYSDPHDQVPHTPEVCARQEGCIVRTVSAMQLPVPELGPDHASVPISIVDLERAGQYCMRAYVFCANGEFCCSRSEVRWLIGRPGDRYTYFSKIEAAVVYSRDDQRPQALEACQRLLAQVVPVLVAEYFPATADLKRK